MSHIYRVCIFPKHQKHLKWNFTGKLHVVPEKTLTHVSHRSHLDHSFLSAITWCVCSFIIAFLGKSLRHVIVQMVSSIVSLPSLRLPQLWHKNGLVTTFSLCLMHRDNEINLHNIWVKWIMHKYLHMNGNSSRKQREP